MDAIEMEIGKDVLRRVDTLTFDCYGTLVDWRAGLRRSLSECFGRSATDRAEELFRLYVEMEAEVESETFRPYRQVMSRVAQLMARRLKLPLSPGRETSLAESLPDWPVFPDTNAALARLKRRFRLGVLSNIDRDLFTATARNFAAPFDFVITAEDVRGYKPAHGHFRRYLEEFGERDSTLHVAQSLYHDSRPARELGIAFAWINRYGEETDPCATPRMVFPDLISLADIADDGHGH